VAEHPKVREMRFCTKINSFLGLLAAGLLSLFSKSPSKPATDDLKRVDFKTSTQVLGVRFSEKIRDVFRFKWIKRTDKTDASDGDHPGRGEESHSCK
jgi:hypothetical protein